MARSIETEIETARLRLRPWREEDLNPYARMCADPEVMRYLPGTLTREESMRQIERFVRHWEEHGFGLWAVEGKAGGEFIGFVGLMRQDDWPVGEHKVEVGWRLDRRSWGNGFATEGAVASLRYGFDRLKLPRIISICDPRNTASRRVMEKAGLTFRGEARWRGYDDVWYAADCRDWLNADG
ncbi:MAG: GNAT family N-acetyltransferase [Rubrobacter sp.]|nr:GNAT family N-acetyltransferase [Rubrobacter sp.]